MYLYLVLLLTIHWFCRAVNEDADGLLVLNIYDHVIMTQVMAEIIDHVITRLT